MKRNYLITLTLCSSIAVGLLGRPLPATCAESGPGDEKPATDPGRTAVVQVANPLAATAAAVTPNAVNVPSVPRIQFVLRWNSYPSDLDSHLLTPAIDGYTYHIYYASRGSPSSDPFAWLNQDVTSGYGPETITMEESFPGVYHYFVYQYSSGGDFGVSGANVQILTNGVLQQTINVPTAGTGRYWDVGLVDGNTGNFYLINELSQTQPTNSPVAVRIMSPLRSGTIMAGDSLRFLGRYTGIYDLQSATLFWDFGDGRTSNLENPGFVTFQTNGTKTVTLSLQSAGSITNFAQDTRTISVVSNTNPAPDLVAAMWLGTTNLAIGQSVPVSYVVTNRGNAAVSNVYWTDAIYLSVDSVLDADDLLLTSTSMSRLLQPGDSYTNTVYVTLPTLGEGAYNLIVSVDDNWQILEQHRLNNLLATTVGAVIPRLTNDVPHTASFANDNASHYYQINVPAGQTLTLSLLKANDDGATELYARYGALPARSTYDYRATGGATVNPSLLIPSTTAGTLYILAYGADIGTSGTYSLTPHLAPIILTSIGASQLCATQAVSFAIFGAGFAAGDSAALVGTNGATYPATTLAMSSSTQLTVTFAANSVPPGLYSVQVSGGGGSATLTNVLTLQATGVPHFVVNLISPGMVGYHMPSTFYVVYTNTGTASMPAPLVVFTMTQNNLQYGFLTLDSRMAGQSFWTGDEQPGYSHSIQFLASGAIPGLLQPGESARIEIYYAGWKQDTAIYGTALYGWDASRASMTFSLNTLAGDDSLPIDWTALGRQVRPPGISDELWSPILTNLENQIGTTWGQYVAALDANLTSLSQLGLANLSISNLFALELRQAEGFGTAGISGRVINATTQHGLTNVPVHDLSADFSSAADTLTDGTGAFTLTGLTNGVQKISLTGYLIASNATVTISNELNVTGVELVAQEAAHVNGHVKSLADGRALTNVLIKCDSQTTNQTFEVLSDASGYYNFATLPADTYTVSCAPDGFISGSITGVVVVLGQNYANNDLNLLTGATISGIAHSEADGSVLADVTVQIQGQNNGLTFTATTGADGSYLFTAIPADTYTLQCLLFGRLCQTLSGLSVSSGQTLSGEDVNVDGASISGTVLAKVDGSAIVGAQLTLLSNQTVVAASITTTNGQYSIFGVPPGLYNIEASATNFAPAYLTNIVITTASTQLVVQLEFPASINGIVALNGQPVTNAFLLLSLTGITNQPVSAAITEAGGMFNFPDLASGTYNLTILDTADAMMSTTNGITLTNGQNLDLGTIVLIQSQASVTAHAFTPTIAAAATTPAAALSSSYTGGYGSSDWPVAFTTAWSPGWNYYFNTPNHHPTVPDDANNIFVQFANQEIKKDVTSVLAGLAAIHLSVNEAMIFSDYLLSTEENPTRNMPLTYSDQNSDIVKGFVNSPVTIRDFNTITNIAFLIVKQIVLNSSSAQAFEGGMDIDKLLCPDHRAMLKYLLYSPANAKATTGQDFWDWNYDPRTIPADIAGGSGEGDLYPDSRWVTGKVYVTLDGNHATVNFGLTLNVLDTFDFLPGFSDSPPVVKAVILMCQRLETYDLAYDVTYEVKADMPLTQLSFDLPSPPTLPVPQPPCIDCTTNILTVPGPQDPNAKIGPIGYGPKGYVAIDSILPYTIYFENSTNATGPAQQVFVWDYLSTNLDWSTFELDGIGFGSQYIPIPPASDYFATNVLISSSNVNIEVQIEAGIDFSSGKVFANFTSLDPVTQLPPAVNIGFLPPDDGTGIGLGYVSYFVDPKSNLSSGTQITNVAFIQFDEEPVIASDQVNDENAALGIDTNKVCLITIDAGAPSSEVLPLPAVETNQQFTVSWIGADDTNGSGIANYIIYYSTNGSTFNVWLANTTNTSATFTGYPGMTNYFYSIAQDNVGYVEDKATLVEAETFVPANASSIQVVSSILNTNLDRQTGLFYQTVLVANPGAGTITGLRFTATNLPAIALTNPVTLISATGTNGQGAPYIDYAGSLAPNTTNTFTLSYYSRLRKAPVGVGVLVEVTGVVAPTNSTGTTFSANKPFTRPDGKLAFEFSTLKGRTYVIQYSSDLVTWKQAQTQITGSGTTAIWVDAGPPDTVANTANVRYYRVVLLPQ